MTAEEIMLNAGYAPLARDNYNAPTEAWIHEDGSLVPDSLVQELFGTIEGTCEEIKS